MLPCVLPCPCLRPKPCFVLPIPTLTLTHRSLLMRFVAEGFGRQYRVAYFPAACGQSPVPCSFQFPHVLTHRSRLMRFVVEGISGQCRVTMSHRGSISSIGMYLQEEQGARRRAGGLRFAPDSHTAAASSCLELSSVLAAPSRWPWGQSPPHQGQPDRAMCNPLQRPPRPCTLLYAMLTLHPVSRPSRLGTGHVQEPCSQCPAQTVTHKREDCAGQGLARAAGVGSEAS